MSKGKLLAVCAIWLVIAGLGAGLWKWVIAPSREEEARSQRQERLQKSGSPSQFAHEIHLALDSFSGYAVLRSEELRNRLSSHGIKLTLHDDGADYDARIKALRDREVDLATFTIDALIKVSADIGDIPATIIALIDETRGADAMVAYKEAVPDLDALNRSDMRFVLTPNSPSETLARVVRHDFQLDKLPDDCFDEAADAEDVYKKYRSSKPQTPQVFVLWEPYVTKVLENPNTHVLVDSSRFRGYIVDVLVANRDFLIEKPDQVKACLSSYFESLFSHRNGMVDLVLDDARRLGTPLSKKQAQRLVKGVWWKNTQENYAHIGISPASGLQQVEAMITNLTVLLTRSGAIRSDPTQGVPNHLYFKGALEALRAERFHPGNEAIREHQSVLVALSDEQWRAVAPVGTLEVPPLFFARGTARLESRSKKALDELVRQLRNWPSYYLTIRGNASRRGDLEANKLLAGRRAQAARDYLISVGINADRVRALGVEPKGDSSVEFIFGQLPY